MISVVCVYNDEITLKDALLKSLENQTLKHELILVDNTQGKFKSAAEAFNWGGAKAKGEYIMFVHQDVDLCSNSWLENAEKLVNSIPNLGIAGVGGARSSEGPTIGECVTNIKHGIPPKTVLGAVPVQKPEKVQTVDECLVIIPRPVFDMLQFDEEVCDDWHLLYTVDYSLSVARLGLDAYVIPSFIYHRSKGIPNRNILQIIWSIGILPTEFYQTLEKLLKKHRSHTKQVYATSGFWSTSYPLILHRVRDLRYYLLSPLRKAIKASCGKIR
jgi:glycosyltransferase involved in cell wall biosynthesis